MLLYIIERAFNRLYDNGHYHIKIFNMNFEKMFKIIKLIQLLVFENKISLHELVTI